ncbi:Protein of unknown function DUF604 [Carpediemonas membranifera]|uniref:Uncharacterized protein n=1 Tax=Carpediemonas membranifera TaxID=201153 RepID=A0A8J6AV42_9EUKA|nr:Protein of unknown function DUF604 [Carpediemonas membranifera]|eukprot:KAG9394948.1 Protein of unknown function DUF604 [Carpediemonas membranifera]
MLDVSKMKSAELTLELLHIRRVLRVYKIRIMILSGFACLSFLSLVICLLIMTGSRCSHIPIEPIPRGTRYGDFQAEAVMYASEIVDVIPTDHRVAFSVLSHRSQIDDRYLTYTRRWAEAVQGPVYVNTDGVTPETQELIESDGHGVVVMPRELLATIRFYLMALDLFEREPGSDWFVLVDDDCLLFVPNLLALLATFDPAMPLYLGGTSERSRSVARHGWMASGGAGAVLSRAAMARLVALGSLDCLLDHPEATNGDELLSLCVFDAGVPFTPVPGLHQLDLRGDASGYVEGVLSRSVPVSMHHLGSIDRLYPSLSNEVTVTRLLNYTRPETLFQRAVGHVSLEIDGEPCNATISVVRGFRAQLWDSPLPLSTFARVSKTWRDSSKGEVYRDIALRSPSAVPRPLTVYYGDDGVYRDGRGLSVSTVDGDCGGLPLCGGAMADGVLNVTVDWDAVSL